MQRPVECSDQVVRLFQPDAQANQAVEAVARNCAGAVKYSETV